MSLAVSPSLRPPCGRAGFLCESRAPESWRGCPPPSSPQPGPGSRPPTSLSPAAEPGERGCVSCSQCHLSARRGFFHAVLGLWGKPQGGGSDSRGGWGPWTRAGVGREGGVCTPHTGKEAANTGPFVLRPGRLREPSEAGSMTCVLLKRALPATRVAWPGAPGRTRDVLRRVLRRGLTPRDRAASGGVPRLWLGSAFRRQHRPLSASTRAAAVQPRGRGGLHSPGRVPRGARCHQGPWTRAQCHSPSPSCRWPCWGAVGCARLGEEALQRPAAAGARSGSADGAVRWPSADHHDTLTTLSCTGPRAGRGHSGWVVAGRGVL